MGTVSICGMVAVWGGRGGDMDEHVESHAIAERGEARVPWEGRARASRGRGPTCRRFKKRIVAASQGRRQTDESTNVTPKIVHTLVFLVVGEVNETLEDGSGWCRFAAPLQLVIGPPLRHPSLLPGGPAIQIRCKGKIKQDLI